MILEHAILSIRPGSEASFEAAFPRAILHLAGSGGYISHALRRSIETPNRYHLLVYWQTLEDHTEGFRGSVSFVQWRAIISPFSDAPPVVEHSRLIAD
ncbi:antibiotic biosynthesis monooxygenase family protein [Hydrocarboniphaga sp.]|uniref:antibiotic biosynthesis monooxygenase family protein n=1 Tax=Hydrocarboniphaga sp. TaxID=2033016 RepID=UPI003D0E39D6